MSLFVGNVARDVRQGDLEKEFEKYGKCEIRLKVCFPFFLATSCKPLLLLAWFPSPFLWPSFPSSSDPIIEILRFCWLQRRTSCWRRFSWTQRKRYVR